jgi:hypothetical protein
MRFVNNTWLGGNMETVESLFGRLEEGAFSVPNSKSSPIQTADRRMILRILQSSIKRIGGDLAE